MLMRPLNGGEDRSGPAFCRLLSGQSLTPAMRDVRGSRRGLVALCMWVGLVAGSVHVNAAEPIEEYKLAVGLYNKGRWELAAESFEGFLKAAPDHPNAERARYYLGLTWFNAEQYEKSRTTLRDFEKRHPQSQRVGEATYWMGYASFLLNDFTSSATELERFRAAAKDDPLLERALPMLGESLLRNRQVEAAEKVFTQSLASHPDGALAEDARFGLARANELLGKSAEAIRIYEKLAADKTSVRAAEARLNLGIRHYDDGRFTEAEAAFTQLLAEQPESSSRPLAALNLGFARYQLSKFPLAAEAFLDAAKSPKYSGEGLLWAGFSHKAAGDFAKASEVFSAGFEKQPEGAAGEKLLYHWADSVQRQGIPAKARELHLDLVKRFPKGTLADASLLAAANLALTEKQPDQVAALLARLETEYPQSPLKDRAAVLKGRLSLEKNDLIGAIKLLEPTIGTPDPLTQAEARYVLSVAYQRSNEFARAVTVTDPIIADLAAGKLGAELSDIWLVRATSGLSAMKTLPRDGLEERKAAARIVGEAADKFLATPEGKTRGGEAIAAKAASAAEAGDRATADATLARLKKQFPSTEAAEKGLFQTGEAAFGIGEFAWAESLFAEVARGRADGPYRGRALVELGWSLSRQKKFDTAAAAFAEFTTSFPKDPLFAEAQVMQGTALTDAGKVAEAIPVFDQAWSAQGTSDHAYVAGLQRARLRKRLMKLDEADVAYQELTDRFPTHPEADQILDEWATVNYDGERFARADEVFALLVKRFPQSPLADNAQLVLAESLLVSGKPKDAAAQFEALASSATSDDVVKQRSLYQLTRVAAADKDWVNLSKVATRLLEGFPEGTYRQDASYAIAEALFESGDFAGALPKLEELRGLSKPESTAKDGTITPPWLPRAWVMLAESRFQQKQYDGLAELAAEFRRVLPTGKLHYQVEAVAARALKAQAKFPEARALYERVVDDSEGRLTETAARAQFEIAETLLLEKNYSSALKAYLKVEIRYKYPKWQGLALYQVAACHEALGEWKDAVRTYESLIQTYADHEMTGPAKEKLEAAKKRVTS